MALTRKDIENIIGDKIEDKDTLNKIVTDIVTKHSDTLQAVVEENRQYKADLEQRAKDLDNLKKAVAENEKTAGEAEKVQKSLTELQEKYAKETAEYQSKLTQAEIDKSLDVTITAAKGKYPDKIKKLLDMEAIKSSKNRDDEIKTQVNTLVKETPELFTIEEQTKSINTGGNASGGTNGLTKEQFNKMSYSDRVNLYNTDKAAYEKLKGD